MRIRNLIILIVLVAALLIAKFVFFPAETQKENSGKSGKDQVVNVTAFYIQIQKLNNEVYASGTILANEEVQLQTELSGKIVQLNFKEGGQVSKGQLLVKINDTDLQAQFKKLQLQSNLANEKLKRQEQLLAIKGISQEEFDIAKNQFDVIKADLDNATAQISKTEIRAPFNGIIGLKNVSEGAYVSPATIIATIQQIDPVKVDFSVSEKYASLVKKGDKVSFSVQGSDKKRYAEVMAIEPRIDMATRSLHIRAISANTKEDIYPGAFARVELALADIDSAIMIPTESIVPELKGQKVYRVKNGKAEPVKVITGLRTDKYIQITDGLLAGDTVITSGLMQLKPNGAVKVIELKKN